MPHIHEKVNFTVEVFIVYKDKVLRRKHDKYGIWLAVGGHIELDEDPVQAALREVKEEVGLNIELIDSRGYTQAEKDFRELIPPVSMNRHRVSDTHEHVTLVYFARSASDKVIPEKPTDQWKWCAVEDIDKLDGMKPNIAFSAKRALRELSGQK